MPNDERRKCRVEHTPTMPYKEKEDRRSNDNKAYAKREKYYMTGTLFPDIKVGMTKVNLTPTVTKD